MENLRKLQRLIRMSVSPHCSFQPLAPNVAQLHLHMLAQALWAIITVTVFSNWRFFFLRMLWCQKPTPTLRAIQRAQATKLLTEQALKVGRPNSAEGHFKITFVFSCQLRKNTQNFCETLLFPCTLPILPVAYLYIMVYHRRAIQSKPLFN